MRLILLTLAVVVLTAGCTTRSMTKQEALLTAAALMIYKVRREDSIKDNIRLTETDTVL